MLVYLAAPYNHTDPSVIEYRINAVTHTLAKLISEGNNAITPLLNHFILNSGVTLPSDYVFWHSYCTEVLKRCDYLYVLRLPGWDKSLGVLTEIKTASDEGIPVLYLDYNPG